MTSSFSMGETHSMLVHLGTQMQPQQILSVLGDVQDGEIHERRQITTPCPGFQRIVDIETAGHALLAHASAVREAKAAWDMERTHADTQND